MSNLIPMVQFVLENKDQPKKIVQYAEFLASKPTIRKMQELFKDCELLEKGVLRAGKIELVFYNSGSIIDCNKSGYINTFEDLVEFNFELLN